MAVPEYFVHELERLGAWTGAPLSFALPTEPDGLKTAILVQAVNGGPILAAETNG